MDIHKPKPFHGWRELLKEVGVIVLGVLIALGAEQAVEALHWRHTVAVARADIHAELTPQLAYAAELVALHRCTGAQLDVIEAAILDSGADRGRPLVAKPYRIGSRPWSHDAWDAAKSAGVIAHMDAGEALGLGQLYEATAKIEQNSRASQDDTATLRALSKLHALSPQGRESMLGALERVRIDELVMAKLGAELVDAARTQHIVLDNDGRETVAQSVQAVCGSAPAAAA